MDIKKKKSHGRGIFEKKNHMVIFIVNQNYESKRYKHYSSGSY